MPEKDFKIDQSSENGNNEEYGVGSFLLEVIKIFVLAIIIIIPIRIFLFQPFFVQGASMQPNFHDGEYLIINEFGYKKTEINVVGHSIFTVTSFKKLERGDVIVFRYPQNPKQYFIKRVIAFPGEKIEISSGKVTIYNASNLDGFVLNENSYLDKDVRTQGKVSRKLGEEEYFVMGDNRSFSSDSRSWGPVREKDIIGKVILRAWPIQQAELYFSDIQYKF